MSARSVCMNTAVTERPARGALQSVAADTPPSDGTARRAALAAAAIVNDDHRDVPVRDPSGIETGGSILVDRTLLRSDGTRESWVSGAILDASIGMAVR